MSRPEERVENCCALQGHIEMFVPRRERAEKESNRRYMLRMSSSEVRA